MNGWLNIVSHSVFRRFLPRRLATQLLVFVGVTVALAAILSGIFFTYATVSHARAEVEEEILFVAKNVAATTASLIITKDFPAIEEVLALNASFPYVDAILLVDANGRVLSEVLNDHGKTHAKFGSSKVTIQERKGSVDVATGQPQDNRFWSVIFPGHVQLELWHPIKAGSLLGAVRIRYNLDELNQTVDAQWRNTLILTALVVIGVMVMLVLLLRAPMQALRETTVFSRKLNAAIGEQMRVYQGTEEIQLLAVALNGLSSQLKYQEEHIADQGAQSKSILDNIVDGVITIDANGIVRSFNAAATNIFGYVSNEVIGRNVRMLMPEQDRSQHDAYLQRYQQSGIGKIIGVGRETEGQRQNGEIFAMDLAISRSFNHGEVIFIGVVRDITERRRLDRLKSEFVSTVSHELRTPLTSIHGSLKLVQAGVTGVLPEATLKLISVAEKNSQRLILLINDLLDMEKIASGKMAITLLENDLVSIVESSIQENAAYGAALNVQYVLDEHPERLLIMADAARINQVLANLLSNAAKFSGESKQVDIRIRVVADKARVEVEDHGDGIPLDFQSEIFGAFAQANNGNTRKQGGTGLGLKISKALIEAMRGDIGFETTIGKGTIFWFSVPLAIEKS